MTWKPAVRRAERHSMRHVAERAGVAVSSVSRVLSGHPDVSERMRAKVMHAVDELGYHPDLLAQSMRWRATLTCEFIVHDIANRLFAEMVNGAERVLEASGYSMLLTNSEGNPERDMKAIRRFEQRRVDGLLLSLASETYGPTIEVLRSLDVPMVVIDRDVPQDVSAAGSRSRRCGSVSVHDRRRPPRHVRGVVARLSVRRLSRRPSLRRR